jgi:hypothetical protein
MEGRHASVGALEIKGLGFRVQVVVALTGTWRDAVRLLALGIKGGKRRDRRSDAWRH